jgi:uncharacterized protein
MIYCRSTHRSRPLRSQGFFGIRRAWVKGISAGEIIERFGLEPLPREGGMFVVTYRSDEMVQRGGLPERYGEARPLSNAILYLLTDEPESYSALHRLPTDEVYHFYLGDPVEMLLLHPEGRSEQVTLGQDILEGQHVQFVVPRGVWQGARVRKGGRFALMGTTLAPGYSDIDYEHGLYEELAAAYPGQAEMIGELARPLGE